MINFNDTGYKVNLKCTILWLIFSNNINVPENAFFWNVNPI